MKRRLGVVVGLDYHARFLANLVNGESRRWHLRAFGSSRIGTLRALLALRSADALICFGGPAPNSALSIAAKRFDVPVLVIWAGSDVIKAQSDPFGLEMVKQEHFANLAVAPWLVDELQDIGIQARYQRVAGMSPGRAIEDLPQAFSVLTYLPEPRRDFYGAPLVYEAARAMPDVEFTVVGAGDADSDAPPNVLFCGHVKNMQERIDASTVLLRQPQHDGNSVLVLEALARARHVIWNYEFPHVLTAASVQSVVAQLQSLRRLHDAGELQLNRQGRKFVLDNFSREDIAAQLEARLDESLLMHRSRPGAGRRRVAISGLGLFCGSVVNQAAVSVPEWDTRLLRTGSRLELLASIATMMSCAVWYSIGSAASDRLMHQIARLLRKPRVIHWVGSDIARLVDDPRLLSRLSGSNILHLAEVTWTANQLTALGLQVRIAPLPPRHRADGFTALPERFTVLLYVPRTRSGFYGKHAFEQLMRRLKDQRIRYVVVGGGEIDVPDGVEADNLGWRDNMRDLYPEATVLIRYTPRDGLSLMVLEALSFGRHVLWTQPFPFVRRIDAYDDMEREVRALLEAHEAGALRPQTSASAFVREQYAPAPCMRAIARAWYDASHPSHRPEVAMETT